MRRLKKIQNLINLVLDLKQSSPPPVLVRFEDDKTRERVFFAAKKFRNSTNLKNIFINRDLTEIEKKLDRDLRLQIKNTNENEETTECHFV